MTETRRPCALKCGISRDNSVVLPAPLQPARPMTFIPAPSPRTWLLWNHRSLPVIASLAKQSRLSPRKDSGLLGYARNDERRHFAYSRPCLYRLDPNVM